MSISRKCYMCLRELPISDFYKDKSSLLGHEYRCKECSHAKNRKHTAKNRRFIKRYKLMKGCIDCGYNKHWAALEFDHVTGIKHMNISHMVRYSIERLKDEIRKCEVRCSNCHHIITVLRK